jgi:Malectin domain
MVSYVAVCVLSGFYLFGMCSSTTDHMTVRTAEQTTSLLDSLLEQQSYSAGNLNINSSGVFDLANKKRNLQTATATNPIRIDCGLKGANWTDPSGNVWLTDRFFTNGWTRVDRCPSASIGGTTLDVLYCSARFWTGNGTVTAYNIPASAGNYQVTLRFAEIYANNINARKFGIVVQGIVIRNSLDLYAMVGKDFAYDVTFPVEVKKDSTVYSNKVKIQFTGISSNMILNAVEVVPLPVAPVPVPVPVPMTIPVSTPTKQPTNAPVATTNPTIVPIVTTNVPVAAPTIQPTKIPVATTKPTNVPLMPTTAPLMPTTAPLMPTTAPIAPVTIPVAAPTKQPTKIPVATAKPTNVPLMPTTVPLMPTTAPIAPVTIPVAAPTKPPTKVPVATTIPTSVPIAPMSMPVAGPETAIRINTGSDVAWIDPVTGLVWEPDMYHYGPSGGFNDCSKAILGTELDAVFCNYRCFFGAYGATNGYNIPVSNPGLYTVKLYFAEVYFDESDKRAFQVTVQGKIVAELLDLVALVGHHEAYVITTVVEASLPSKLINIQLTSRVENAILNGIEILPGVVTPAPVAPTPPVSRHYKLGHFQPFK